MGVLGSVGPVAAHRRVDLALAAAVTALTVAGAVGPEAAPTYGFGDGGVGHLGAAAAMGVVLYWRRQAPLAVFAMSTALIAATSVLQGQPGWQPLAWFIAAYALAAHAPRPRAALGLGLGLAGVGLLVVLKAPYFDSWLAVGAVLQLVVAWLLGVATRRSRVDHDVSRERLEAARREAAVAAEASARLERLRLARDLHDSVTNALSGVVVQAAVLRRTRPGTADAHLEAIEARGRETLVELRRMLGALRDGSVPDAAPVAGGSRAGASPGMRLSREVFGAGSRAPDLPARWGLWPVDAAFALAVAAINVTGSVVADPFDPTPYREPVLPVLVVLAALPGLSLLLRRRWPAVPLVVAAAVVTLFDALLWQHGNLPVTVLIAAFSVGAWLDVRRGAVTVAAVAAMVVAVHPMTPVGQVQDDLWLLGPLLVLPWLVGVGVRAARLRAARAQDAAAAAEERITALRRGAAADERLRVARDLHDLIGHRLAEVVVQIVTARRIATPDLDAPLAAIETEARGALESMRSMLSTLDTVESPAVAPAPGLTDIEDLASRHRRSHGPVELTLDPTLEQGGGDAMALTAYRIVQEALANAARHAAGATVTVSVRDLGDTVEVRVEDDGRLPVAVGAAGRQAHDGGLGLVGMRERVSLAGGRLDAVPRHGGGFTVRAVLPNRRAGR
ncbi:MAG: histidine kinase [Actinobacteria bacterium]|nr:histidine kinase [Actinomycetota bacterium]